MIKIYGFVQSLEYGVKGGTTACLVSSGAEFRFRVDEKAAHFMPGTSVVLTLEPAAMAALKSNEIAHERKPTHSQ